jgi:threonine/homoserine/homoserine lactone efflux protein
MSCCCAGRGWHLLLWGGVLFLLYMAWKLASDDGQLQADTDNGRLQPGTARQCSG